MKTHILYSWVYLTDMGLGFGKNSGKFYVANDSNHI